MLSELKILKQHGKQFIPNIRTAEIPMPFRGQPLITKSSVDGSAVCEVCPVGAITADPLSIDMGKCVFCGDCAQLYPEKIKFTNNYKIATNNRQWLSVTEGVEQPVELDAHKVRSEIKSIFKGSLKLRQVSAGGDASTEMELGACGNVNFDMGRFGIEFVASPRHADGVVVTGPITKNMARALEICYEAIPVPKLLILAGTDAISGGIFLGSEALNRDFLDKYQVDLFVPGNPPHPLTFINGILDLIKSK